MSSFYKAMPATPRGFYLARRRAAISAVVRCNLDRRSRRQAPGITDPSYSVLRSVIQA